jgi:hypothetical protein
MAREADPRRREAALLRLVQNGAVAELLPYLGAEDAALRNQVLEALQLLGPALAPYLPALLVDADPDIRILTCELVRRQPGAAATALLAPLLLTETEANMCAAMLDVLAEIGTAEALPALRSVAARFPDDAFLAFASQAVIARLHDDQG